MADERYSQAQHQQMVYNWIQFQKTLSEPQSPLITSDVTRAVLSKQGCNFIRRLTLFANMLKTKGFHNSAKMVIDLAGAYAIATLGMGNYAMLIAQSVWSVRAFMYPEEQKEDDIISSISKHLQGFLKKKR